MPELFNGEDVDLSAIYRDSAAPKATDPAETLFGQLGAAIKPPVSTQVGGRVGKVGGVTVAQRGAPTASPFSGRGGLLGPPTPIGGGSRPAGASSTGQASSDSTALLARLKPLGITNLNSLRSKSDVELRQLSQDVVTYELRQQAMNKYYKQNPDGSYDFTVGPDGRPTGLDATGKPIVPGAASTTGTKPAPATAPTVKPPAPKPAPKPAPRPVGKTSTTRRTTSKKTSTTRRRSTSTRPSTKVTRPPVKKTTTKPAAQTTFRRGGAIVS